jgi:hypothetical protein
LRKAREQAFALALVLMTGFGQAASHDVATPEVRLALTADEAHAQIDAAGDLTEPEKAHLHAVVRRASREHKIFRDGLYRMDRLYEEHFASADPDRRAEIKAEIGKQMDQVSAAVANLATERARMFDELDAIKKLTGAQRTRIDAILHEILENRVSASEARAQLKDVGTTERQLLILLLVISVIFVFGCGW